GRRVRLRRRGRRGCRDRRRGREEIAASLQASRDGRANMAKSEEEHDGPVIPDRRRIDPRTGQVKDPTGGAAPGRAAQAAVAGVAKARAAKQSASKARGGQGDKK